MQVDDKGEREGERGRESEREEERNNCIGLDLCCYFEI